MAQYPQLFKPIACEAANKACQHLDRQAALAKAHGDFETWRTTSKAKKVLWLDTYLVAAKGEEDA
jgi:hypothetical protein